VHELQLTNQLVAGLRARPFIRLIGDSPTRASMASFVMEGAHASDVGTLLDQQGVAVRTGHHCAMPVMEHFGVPATVRASFGMYNSADEVEIFLAALDKTHRILGS
jgi:cysteine desulfurase/selenocysteine lyase